MITKLQTNTRRDSTRLTLAIHPGLDPTDRARYMERCRISLALGGKRGLKAEAKKFRKLGHALDCAGLFHGEPVGIISWQGWARALALAVLNPDNHEPAPMLAPWNPEPGVLVVLSIATPEGEIFWQHGFVQWWAWSLRGDPRSTEKLAVEMAHRLEAFVTDLREAIKPHGTPNGPLASAAEVGVFGSVLTLEAARAAA